ncbi:MAG: hypothetical protein ABI887_06435 [Burkholderiales bacterium]
MKRNDFAFKNTEFFEWDSEPKTERPSEFHTTGFSTASGYYHTLSEPSHRTTAREPQRRGTVMLILGLMIAIGFGAAGVIWLTRMLHG